MVREIELTNHEMDILKEAYNYLSKLPPSAFVQGGQVKPNEGEYGLMCAVNHYIHYKHPDYTLKAGSLWYNGDTYINLFKSDLYLICDHIAHQWARIHGYIRMFPTLVGVNDGQKIVRNKEGKIVLKLDQPSSKDRVMAWFDWVFENVVIKQS